MEKVGFFWLFVFDDDVDGVCIFVGGEGRG